MTIYVMRDGWNLTYLLDPRIYELEGELEFKDGYLVVSSQEMTLDHRGLTLRVRYELAPALRDLSFHRLPDILDIGPRSVEADVASLEKPRTVR